MPTPLVEIQHVSKYFAKVVANKDVSLTVKPGEVLALLGENGAGKSTIMKILYGLYKKDEGKILFQGEELFIKSPSDAMKKGIAMIQQHFSLVPSHTGTENIILGNVHGYVSLKDCNEKIRRLAQSYKFDVPVDKKVKDLAVGLQQKLEILKALYIDAKLLIMDEPTAVLTPQESATLMAFIKDFAAKGNSVIFITHKLKEVMDVADRIIVMRNGAVVDSLDRKDCTESKLASLMMGQTHKSPEPRLASRGELESAETVLEFRQVSLLSKSSVPLVDKVSFSVHRGEIFGVAGVSGNGQDELCDLICGAIKPSSGQILLDGKDLGKTSIRKRLEAGLGYVPVDRYRDAMVMEMSLAENLYLKKTYSPHWRKHGFVRQDELQRYTRSVLEKHRVKANGPWDLAKSLSGGNQQKVVLAREVDQGEKLLVLNQPTRGLDMGAVDRIHKLILEEKARKKGILLISTELPEIFEMCDRLALMYKGQLMGIYENGALSTEEIGLLMAGIHRPQEAVK